ncbi:MAG: rRNA maturation RNase YbeY [Lentisphaerota bacterium]
MKVYYSKPRKTNLKIVKTSFYKLLSEIVKLAELKVSRDMELSVNFINSKTICKMNIEYVGHEGITDVITFNYLTPEDFFSGSGIFAEIFICIDKAIIEANERNIDFADELSLYIVHGILHIAGYDDLKPKDLKEMRKAEILCMTALKKQFNLNNIFNLKIS